MPPKTTKRKAKGFRDDGPSETPDDRPQKRTRVSTSHVDNLDADNFSQSTKPLSSWIAWQTKFNEKERTEKRLFAENFKSELQGKQDESTSLLATSNHDLAVAGDRYMELVEEVRLDSKTSSKAGSQPQTLISREEHPLFKAFKQTLQNCHDLIAVHERTNSQVTQDKSKLGLPNEQWKEDIASVEELLLYGRQHGENLVDCIVIPSRSHEEKKRLLAPDKEELSETGKMAVDMYRNSMEGVNEGGLTWGEMAKGQAGAIGKVLDDLTSV